MRAEFDSKIETLAENEALASEIKQVRKDFRLLNGVLRNRRSRHLRCGVRFLGFCDGIGDIGSEMIRIA